jgi:LuxR family transcriptional regulator, maltose regulon positive regulatory protein
MSTPILATKLYTPASRPGSVLRPRLIERLNEGLHRRLTLVSAPAGFGKTTLLGGWLANCGRPGAWLSLDEGDGDPARFLAYLVTALQTAAGGIGEGVLGALRSPQPPLTESTLTALLNDMSAIPNGLVLVLDDYHVIDARAVDDALAFLLEHLPPQVHLVIATREDPQLPLARLRARGQLAELRAADLRFTSSEANEFLTGVMELSLSAEDIAALETRTEGWIAGLQLAALSMRGREDASGFVRAFAGDNRYVVDYLVEEVLQSQPESVRNFLLQTSVLERLGGPLCDAVTGQEDSRGMLKALERGNLFVVPLDDRRRWYRYHHLFAEVLYTHLMAEEPDLVATLHRRASEWYEHNGSAADAIRHALAAGDFERAADLIELAVPATRRSRQEATLLGWLKALPDELFHCRPVLNVHYAGTLLQSGQLDGVEDRLLSAERWLDTTAATRERPDEPAAEMVVMHEEAFRRLPGSIAMYRAGIALARGNVPETVTYARRVLDLAPEDDHFRRGAAAALLGLASWTSGDLEAAHRSYADGMAHLQQAGYISDAVGGSMTSADIRIAQGRLGEAMRTYEHALRLAAEHGDPVMRGTADMHVGMSEVYRERNDLDAATQQLLISKEQGEHTGFPQYPYRWRVAMARILDAEGDLNGALDLLDEAERLYVGDFHPNVRPIAALRARIWVAQGRLGEALGWAREHALSAYDDPSYVREFEHVTLARVLLAQYKIDRADGSMLEAMGLLERLLQAAEAGGRMGSAIEILVLQALAQEAQGDLHAALVLLERALTLAAPEGYVRVFVDEGRPMARLLYEALSHGVEPEYTRRLLAAFPVAKSRQTTSSQSRGPESEWVEPLSARELEVLQLIAEGLTNQDVASRLYLSPHTAKVHTRNIFTKLAVKNRTQAVARGKALGIMPQT